MSFLDVMLFISAIIFFFPFSRGKEETKIFDRDSTAALRGIAMIGIILHHIHNSCCYSSPILSAVGYLATALFFFISGYGNEISLNKENINIKWIINKFLKLYIPFTVCYILYFFVLRIGYDNILPSFKEILIDLLTISLINQVSWFPKVILGSFVIHWICKKIFNNKKLRIIALLIIPIIFILIMKILNYPIYWYNSVLCYSIGILVSELELELVSIRKNIKNINSVLLWIIRIIPALLFMILFVLSKFNGIFSIFSAVAFSLTCYIYTDIFTTKSKILSLIGNNSFEFYLFHILCLQLFDFLIDRNDIIYAISVIIGTIAIVYMYLKCKKKIEIRST